MCTAHPTGRSRRTGLAYPNGAAIAYSYDAASRLLCIDNQTNSGQHKYAYTYDYVGNRMDMTVTSPSGVGVHLYDYDKIYQVTEVDYPDELDYLATDTTFHYDDAGNRLSVIDGGGTTPYVANALNQYTSANGTYYQYDTSGNMIYDGHYVFDYDPENRLNKVKRFEQGPTALALACDTTLTFTMGGDADWFTQTQEHYFEGDAAQSGDIADSQQSWMQATVSGTGYISFYWKVSSDGGDYLRFYIDDQLKEEHAGSAGWSQSTKYYISTSGSHTLKWVYIKNNNGSEGSDCAWVDKVLWEVPVPVGVDKGVDSLLTYTSGGNSTWSYVTSGYYGGDSAKSGQIPDSNDTWMQTTVEGAGTFKFWWKVSSESGCDELEFYIDNQLQSGAISGSTSWAEKSYNLTGAGTHTLKWRYVKDSSGESGEDCGWVDHVQWSAPIAEPAPDAWSTLTYTYDASGRRIEKRYDDTVVLKYLYDGDHCIAEYDAANNLRRKYILGPCVDEPICMIEGEATNYYHYDALGSVIALSDGDGDTVQVYEYDVHGRVGVTDPDHSNRFMFTGREFDKETGLYYYRARYYNAEIGRFLQTDPIGYDDGMNWYAYCGNSATNRVDPAGTVSYGFLDQDQGHEYGFERQVAFACFNDDGSIAWVRGFDTVEDAMDWHRRCLEGEGQSLEGMVGYSLAVGSDGVFNEKVFWSIRTLMYLCYNYNFSPKPTEEKLSVTAWIKEIQDNNKKKVSIIDNTSASVWDLGFNIRTLDKITWNSTCKSFSDTPDTPERGWHNFPPLASLAHELEHAHQYLVEGKSRDESKSMRIENIVRNAYYTKVPGYDWVDPRPGYGFGTYDMSWNGWSENWLPPWR